MSALCLFSRKQSFPLLVLHLVKQWILTWAEGGLLQPWHQTALFMVCVAVVGVWLIAGSQDVGGFRWYFITLTSPFLIKSRPTLSLRWVTSSICICICVCVCLCLYVYYMLYTCVSTTPLDTIDLGHTHRLPLDTTHVYTSNQTYVAHVQN